jgi:hypothetical protein
MNGIYRFVLIQHIFEHLAKGWTLVCDVSQHRPYEENTAVLMKWCCGDCADGEAP